MKPFRLVIYPKDVQKISGLSQRTSQRLIQQIKLSLGKKKHQWVTYYEFCEFTHTSIKKVENYLRRAQ